MGKLSFIQDVLNGFSLYGILGDYKECELLLCIKICLILKI